MTRQMSRSAGASGVRLLQLCLLLFFALTGAGIADAQTIPGSGQLLQQTPHPAATAPSSNTGLTVQPTSDDRIDAGDTFLVKHIEITGNALLPTSELHSLVSAGEGRMLNFAYLEDLAARISKSYQDHGYLLARAYVPAQTISGGVVQIAVQEARYGALLLSNTSPVSDALLKSLVAPLKPGQPVIEPGLERSLLLLADVPGAVVNSTLAPGAMPGTSDLQIAASPGAPYSGSAALDNGGNRYTGRARLSGTANINDPFHQGDVLSLAGMTAGSGLSYGRLGYQAFINDGAGTNVGGAVSGLYYHLGHGLSDLHAHGTAVVESLTAMQPLVRSTVGNLFAQVGFDSKQLRDEIDATDIHTDRRTDALTLTFAGDRRDAGGISNMSAGLGIGRLEFANDAAAGSDGSAAKTRGDYGKFTLSLARLQALSESNSVYLAFNGQAANKNLDPSEQFFLGGPNSVRAYDVGSVGGADGGLVSAELRHNLRLPIPGAWQAIAFLDAGRVRVYKNTFQPGENSASLSGTGIGVNWVGPGGWTASVTAAKTLGTLPRLVGDTSSSRIWLEIRRAFLANPAVR